MSINILADSAMPYWHEFFTEVGNVITFRAGELSTQTLDYDSSEALKERLSHIQCLLVRSTTQVNKALISLMPKLEFVATATAGYDHLDTHALNAAGITWYAAGGCNAQAVAQYVVCAVLELAQQDKFLVKDKRVAIIGNGNVGSRVAQAMQALGAQVLIYDPPQASAAKELLVNRLSAESVHYSVNTHSINQYCEFSDVLTADIICIHAPLNSHASFLSKHLFDACALGQLDSSQYVINAGRGEIIDNQALLAHCTYLRKRKKSAPNVVLDVWENEPNIMTALIDHVRLASAHIAGHTLEGKANGTFMLYQQLCERYNIAQTQTLSTMLPAYSPTLPTQIQDILNATGTVNPINVQALLKSICHFVYDIQNDDRVFRLHMAQSESFAKLRQEYPIRREFSALTLKVANTNIRQMLRGLGFDIGNNDTQ